jgi:hypothetical protein
VIQGIRFEGHISTEVTVSTDRGLSDSEMRSTSPEDREWVLREVLRVGSVSGVETVVVFDGVEDSFASSGSERTSFSSSTKE